METLLPSSKHISVYYRLHDVHLEDLAHVPMQRHQCHCFTHWGLAACCSSLHVHLEYSQQHCWELCYCIWHREMCSSALTLKRRPFWWMLCSETEHSVWWYLVLTTVNWESGSGSSSPMSISNPPFQQSAVPYTLQAIWTATYSEQLYVWIMIYHHEVDSKQCQWITIKWIRNKKIKHKNLTLQHSSATQLCWMAVTCLPGFLKIWFWWVNPDSTCLSTPLFGLLCNCLTNDIKPHAQSTTARLKQRCMNSFTVSTMFPNILTRKPEVSDVTHIFSTAGARRWQTLQEAKTMHGTCSLETASLHWRHSSTVST
jgi:hypothetical protein